MLGAERATCKEAARAEQAGPVQDLQLDEVFSKNGDGLGGDRAAGLPAGLQHAQFIDPPQEFELFAPRLQLQPEAGEDVDHEGAEEERERQRATFHHVTIRKTIVFVNCQNESFCLHDFTKYEKPEPSRILNEIALDDTFYHVSCLKHWCFPQIPK